MGSLLGILLLAATASPDDVFYRYVDAVLAGDWTRAESFWWPPDARRAHALDIQFEQTPLKVDGASPLIRLAPSLADQSVRMAVATRVMDDRAVIDVRFVAADTLSTRYHVLHRGGRWWLASRTSALADDWPRFEGGFLRVLRHPDVLPTPLAYAEMDAHLGRWLKQMQVPTDRVELLRDEKLRYVLTPPTEVAVWAGAPTEGVANLQEDAVITRHPLHLHEVAHLAVAFALQSQGSFQLPLLQEGVAVFLGGRWGRGPRVFPSLGRFVLDTEIVQLETMLTHDDFRRQPPDVSYPAAAVLVEFLVERMGWPEFLSLLRSLSGSFQDVAGCTQSDVQAQIGAAWVGWDDFLQQFRSWRQKPLSPALRPDPSLPREPTAIERDGVLYFGFAGGHATFALSPPDPDLASRGPGALYREHFPMRAFDGVRWALRIEPGEAGVYDYATDLLLEKYVTAFSTLGPLLVDGWTRLRLDARSLFIPRGEVDRWQ